MARGVHRRRDLIRGEGPRGASVVLLVIATLSAVMLLVGCSGSNGRKTAQPTHAPTPTTCGPTGTPAPPVWATSLPSPGSTATPSPAPSRSASPTPTLSPPPATPTATATQQSTEPVAGNWAYADVSVATVWRSPDSPRAIDEPALENPARIRAWLAAMTVSGRAGLEGRADTQVLLGERVLVVAIASGWAQVVVPEQPTPLDPRGYPGWVPVRQLTAAPPPATAQTATVTAPTAWLTNASGARIVEISFGTTLPALAITGREVTVGLPGGNELEIAAAAVSVVPAGEPALTATAASVVATAKAFTGLPYLWAGTSGFGFDCSGFVYAVYRVHGITLPRDADAQATAGAAVARSDLQPGDLVFFATSGYVHHVALYIGNGLILQAPHAGASIGTASLASEPYNSEFFGARREVGGS